MAYVLLVVMLLGSTSLALQEVVAPRVRVLFASTQLEPYAQRVAGEAERALDALMPVFETVPAVITITISEGSDVYNALATALPRPKTALPALFPVDTDLGYRAEDDLYLLLLHELTHNLQLGYTAGAPVNLGLVGETVAAVPASWFLEGVAVWAESEFSAGGRRDDALTTGLRHSAALEDTWPSLAEASLITYGDWPGGLTRYLYGVGFTSYLIERYGRDGMLAALRAHNASGFLGSFAGAWREAVGADLEADWERWRQRERALAKARAQGAHAGVRRTDTGWYTRAPANHPDGRSLAWVSWPDGIVVAELAAGLDARTLIKADRFPRQLHWLNGETLLYTRIVRRPGTEFSELFALDVASGRETQLTVGARAKLPAVTPRGCALFVRDVVPERARLQRWCEGEIVTLWQAPAGHHILGVAVSPVGQIALSVWRPGGYVDLGVLQEGSVRYLTQDAAQDLEPSWQGETRLVFRSDRDAGGAFDLYALDLKTHTLERLTRTVGGAFSPVVGEAGLWYAGLGAKGYDLYELGEGLGEEAELAPQALPPLARAATRYPVRAYSPWPSLPPYGWLPADVSLSAASDIAAGATLFGQDDAGLHNYALSLGYNGLLKGQLSGAYLNLRYGYRENTLLNASSEEPVSYALQLGLWPHRPHLGPSLETAFGVKGEVSALIPMDEWTGRYSLEAGLISLSSRPGLWPQARLAAVLADERRDPWGYPTRGLRFALTAVLTPTDLGDSAGSWVEASYTQ
ncbi:MAG: hypothetical protein M3511_02310, partial [Deinococcota bacterium]|nr:hypothetical protein [Deinococcota bacterium]